MKKKTLITMSVIVSVIICFMAVFVIGPGIFPWNWNSSFENNPDKGNHSEPLLHEHTYSAWQVEKGTCYELLEVRFCSTCGDCEERITNYPEHEGEWIILRQPTDSTAGVVQRFCTRCGERETKNTCPEGHHLGIITTPSSSFAWYIPSSGSSTVNGTVTKSPTCTEDGEIEIVCSVCKETVTETIAKTGHVCDVWETVTEPTCQLEGEKKSICKQCGETVTEVISTLEHAFGDWQITVTPTCQKAGEKECACLFCGETQTETLPQLSHQAGVWVTNRNPDCLNAGEQCIYCTLCGEKMQSKTVPAMGHEYRLTTPVEECRCGSEITYSCSRCSDSYRETVPELIVSVLSNGFGIVISTSGSGYEYTYTAQAQGGFGQLKYRFEFLKNGKVQLSRDFSEKTECSILLGFGQAPTGYTLKVTVQDEADNTKEAILYL